MNQVTLTITSSPIPTHPEPTVLLQVLSSIRDYCPDLLQCDLIVFFDGLRIVPNEDEQALKKGKTTQTISENYEEYIKRVTWLLTSRWGHESLFESYIDYYRLGRSNDVGCEDTDLNTHRYTLEANVSKTTGRQADKPGSVQIEVVERKCSVIGPRVVCLKVVGRSIGQALGVREMMNYIQTPYVLSAQHDWKFSNRVDIQ